MKIAVPKHHTPVEVTCWVVNLSLLIYGLRSLLLTGSTTLVHDNFYWFYPIYHHYARVLSQGQLPLWNTYMHGGEPFYPLLVQLRLLEPLSVLTVLIGKYFTQDSVRLFNWNHFILQLWMSLGAYFFLRRFTLLLFVRLCLVPLLLFSSFLLGSFHQDSILSQFLWTPWIAYFLLRLFRDNDLTYRNFIFLGISVGINFQSYQFAGPLTYLALFALGLVLFEKRRVQLLLAQPQFFKRALATVGLSISMALPNLVLMWERKNFLFPLRLVPENYATILKEQSGLLPAELTQKVVDVGIQVSYSLIPYTGAFVKIWEFLQLLSPNGNPNIHSTSGATPWGAPSEAYMYIGAWPVLVAWFGFCLGQGYWKKLVGLLTLSMGLLMMGPPGGLHRVLYPILPPLWFIRHTDLFVLYFVFGLLYFFVLGLNKLIQEQLPLPWQLSPPARCLCLCFSLEIYCVMMAMTSLNYPIFKYTETNFLFMGFVVIAGTYAVIRKPLGRLGLYYAVILAEGVLLFSLTPSKLSVSFYLLFFMLAPLLILYLVKDVLAKQVALLALLFLDLGVGFRAANFLYEGVEHPSRLYGFSSQISQPPTLQSRQLYARYPSTVYGRQIPRYLSLLRNTHDAFSPVIYFKGEEESAHPYTLRESLQAPRWNSLLLTQTYAQLVNSDLSLSKMESAFALGDTPVQLRTGNLSTGNNWLWHTLPRNAASMSVTDYGYNSLRLWTESSVAGAIYFADGYDPYWRVERDGIAVPLYQANINFKATALQTGKHSYRFYYQPTPFLIAVGIFYFIPILSLLGLLLFSIHIRVRIPELRSAWEHA